MKSFKQILNEFYLIEGRNADLAKLKLTKAGLESDFEDMLAFDTSKNNKNLPKLVDYYIEVKDLEIVKSYYKRFMSNTALNSRDINTFKTFKDFEDIVDSTATRVNKALGEIETKPIYEDDNIKVFHGDSKEQCIKLSDGYTFCIGRKDSSNLYGHYRYKSETTFYFIRFKGKNDNKNTEGRYIDDAHYIVVQALTDGKYFVTMSNNDVGDKPTTPNQLISDYPALKPLFDKGIIKPIAHTEKEKHVNANILGKDISKIKSVDDQLLWVEVNPNRNIPDDLVISNKVSDEVIKKHIEVYVHDFSIKLKDYLKVNKPKLFERYKQVKANNFDKKIDHDVSPTKDEFTFASNDSFRNFIKSRVTSYFHIPSLLGAAGFRNGDTIKIILEELKQIASGTFKSIYDYVNHASDLKFVDLFMQTKIDSLDVRNSITSMILSNTADNFMKARIEELNKLDASYVDEVFVERYTSFTHIFHGEEMKDPLSVQFFKLLISKIKSELSEDFISEFSNTLPSFGKELHDGILEVFLEKIKGRTLTDYEKDSLTYVFLKANLNKDNQAKIIELVGEEDFKAKSKMDISKSPLVKKWEDIDLDALINGINPK